MASPHRVATPHGRETNMSQPARHRLVLIGPVGDRRAYLDVPRHEAIRRYQQEQICFEGDRAPAPADLDVREFEFTDSFSAYDAWPAR
jgi:glucuronate isomerase